MTASTEQIDKMLKLLEVQQQQQQTLQEQMMVQMTTLTQLQAENTTLRAAAVTVGTTTTATDSSSIRVGQGHKSKTPDRPVINRDIDDREWALLLDRWERYKDMCSITPDDISSIRLELRASCSDDVDKLLFEFVGPTVLKDCTESQLLEHIKSVAVKHTHKEVHRMEFDRMVQEEESVVNYVARLKSKAILCQFLITGTCTANGCNSSVPLSYAEDMIATRLVSGLRNQEHKRKVLVEAATLTTLDAKVKRLQVLETTDFSTSALKTTPPVTSESAAAKSQYKMNMAKKGDTSLKEESDSPKCRWCGRTSHPNGKSLERANCPAKNKSCYRCNKKGHLGAVCENSQAAAGVDDVNEEHLAEIATESSVSFAFGAEEEQDFRLVMKTNVNS